MGDYMLFSYYLPLPYIKMDCALTGTTVPTVHYCGRTVQYRGSTVVGPCSTVSVPCRTVQVPCRWTVHYRAAPCRWLYHRRVADHGLSYIITFPLHLESAGQNVAQ